MTQKTSVRPAVEFATGQAVVKGEDVILVRPRVSFPKNASGGRLVNCYGKSLSDSASSVHVRANGLQSSLPIEEQGRTSSSASIGTGRQGSLQGTGSFGLFCVFDGHNGVMAAQHLEEVLLSTLEEKLPGGHPPQEGEEPAYTQWREELQKAIVETFCDLNEAFACKGQLAGSTITVVLQYGWLLTVANCGDSRALLDTCHEVIQLTVDHRISTHQEDRRRLQALGAQIAPIDGSGIGPAALNTTGYGPLRVWPGGLCLSRGIGDFDIGPPVIACPHIFQVRIPDSGGRLIIASDGIWDGFENMKRLCRMSRNWACQAAPNKVIQALQRAFGGLRDDTSIIVLDVLPPQSTFPEIAQQMPKRPVSAAGSCFCFAPPKVDVPRDAEDAPPKVKVHADLDIAVAVGLVPAPEKPGKPVWCDHDFCQAVSQSQVAACNAWNEARSMRSMGKTPSRQDLASFFSAVHPLKPLPDAIRVDPHDLDVSTRPPLQRPPEDISVHPRRSLEGALADPATAGDEGTQGDASTRFREHVADQLSFARKFGHYKNQMATGRPSCDGSSTTEDDSMRAGVAHDESVDGSQADLQEWQARAADLSWGTPPGGRYGVGADHSPHRTKASLYQLDSAMLSSSGALPTVEEEKPAARRKGIDTLVGGGNGDPHAAEMAVRRGKNRFMQGEGPEEKPTLTASPTKSGRPPLPKPMAAR